MNGCVNCSVCLCQRKRESYADNCCRQHFQSLFFCSWPRLNRVMHPLASPPPPPPPPRGFPAQRVNSGSLKLRHTSSPSAACTGTDRNVRGWVSTCIHSLPVIFCCFFSPPINSELLGFHTVARCNWMKSTNQVWSYHITLHLQCRCIVRNETQSILQTSFATKLGRCIDPVLSHWM